jgi:hypothetical protein
MTVSQQLLTKRYRLRFLWGPPHTSNLNGEITDVGAVTLTVVPEPTCATLFGLTALGLAIRRRK